METFRIANLNITTVKESDDSICYILYLLSILGEWIEEAAYKFGVSIAVITGMDWDDDLTPWPAKGEPPGERTLTGVSLSGLFTLWQWINNDTFDNIISLSGSFWYEDFVAWIKRQTVPSKKGKAYFLLGDMEAKTKVKAFQPVQTDTVEIVDYLHDKGSTIILSWYPAITTNMEKNA